MTSHYTYRLTCITGVSNLELEKIISKDDYYSYFYAKDVLKGRFELGEKIISENGLYSYFYGLNVIKGRFQSGELIIMKNKNRTFNYFFNVLRYNHE